MKWQDFAINKCTKILSSYFDRNKNDKLSVRNVDFMVTIEDVERWTPFYCMNRKI